MRLIIAQRHIRFPTILVSDFPIILIYSFIRKSFVKDVADSIIKVNTLLILKYGFKHLEPSALFYKKSTEVRK